MMRTHSRARGPGATPGNQRRNSTMADNSPSSAKTRRMAAAAASSTANIPQSWASTGRARKRYWDWQTRPNARACQLVCEANRSPLRALSSDGQDNHRG